MRLGSSRRGAGAPLAPLLLLLQPAAAPFSCSTISINCLCEWSFSGAWVQVSGLTKAPKTADDSAETCEQWCCTTTADWKDDALIHPNAKPGRCSTWQYMPPDPTGKENLGCWGGVGTTPDAYGKGSFHAAEWVGAAGCEGITSDWGNPFLVVLLLCSVGYLGGGAVYMRSKGATGRDLLPCATRPSFAICRLPPFSLSWLCRHRSKWMHVRSLVLDGFAFVRGGAKRRAPPAAAAGSSGSDRRKESKQPLLTDGRESKRDPLFPITGNGS